MTLSVEQATLGKAVENGLDGGVGAALASRQSTADVLDAGGPIELPKRPHHLELKLALELNGGLASHGENPTAAVRAEDRNRGCTSPPEGERLAPSPTFCRRAAPRSSPSSFTVTAHRTEIAARLPPVRIAAIALLLLAVGGIEVASAPGKTTVEKLDAVKEKIDGAQDREGVLTSEIEAMGYEISLLEGRVAALRSQEAAAEAELAAKQAELNQATAELERAVEELKTLRDRLQRALISLRERLIAIYMSGSPDLPSIILGASDYGEMVARAEYIEAIRRSDEALAERVRLLRDEAKRFVAVRREAKVTIETARDRIAAEEQRLEETRAMLESRESALLSARARRQQTLDSVKGEIHQHEEVAADLRAKIQAEIAEATTGMPLATGPLPVPSAAGFIWPVEGVFTSPFGPRWGRMHEGIDIAGPEGTPIRAAASGTVILMQSEYESGGYGNYTCLEHGGGLATCYAHQSGFATSLGANVGQGDVIGFVGNTGNSFGAHLHFEVRISGEAVDPMGYL